MNRDLSTNDSNWQRDAKRRCHDRARFIVTDWNLPAHNPVCGTLAEEFAYNYTYDRELGFAFFTPRN